MGTVETGEAVETEVEEEGAIDTEVVGMTEAGAIAGLMEFEMGATEIG